MRQTANKFAARQQFKRVGRVAHGDNSIAGISQGSSIRVKAQRIHSKQDDRQILDSQAFQKSIQCLANDVDWVWRIFDYCTWGS